MTNESRWLRELVTLRLERYKDRLVDHEDPEVRGRAKEMKDFLKFLIENTPDT